LVMAMMIQPITSTQAIAKSAAFHSPGLAANDAPRKQRV
jgi:hypothetical protein